MKRNLVLLASTVLIISACSDSYTRNEDLSDTSSKMSQPTSEAMEEDGASQVQITSPSQDASVEIVRKLIWTADLEFQVKDVESSTKNITEMSEKYGGFVSDMKLASNNYRVSNTITIRVANEKFHAFVSAIKGESIFTDRADISSNDVTEEFVDIESRLKTKREVRERYIKILRERTGDIKDVIEAEEAIRTITEEIEAKEGRLRYLKDKVDNSTVNVTIYEHVEYVAQPDRYEKAYSEEMGDSVESGWNAIKAFFLGILTIWPLMVLLIVLAIWKRKWIAKLFRSVKKEAPKEA